MKTARFDPKPLVGFNRPFPENVTKEHFDVVSPLTENFLPNFIDKLDRKLFIALFFTTLTSNDTLEKSLK